MKVRNKSALKAKFRQGHTGKARDRTGWYTRYSVFGVEPKDPLEFANSDELSKIQNRNRK